MDYQEDLHILITGGKDYAIKIWQLPQKWHKEEIVDFENRDIKYLNDELAHQRIQKMLIKLETEDNSDTSDDDLNGWEIR